MRRTVLFGRRWDMVFSVIVFFRTHSFYFVIKFFDVVRRWPTARTYRGEPEQDVNEGQICFHLKLLLRSAQYRRVRRACTDTTCMSSRWDWAGRLSR